LSILPCCVIIPGFVEWNYVALLFPKEMVQFLFLEVPVLFLMKALIFLKLLWLLKFVRFYLLLEILGVIAFWR